MNGFTVWVTPTASATECVLIDFWYETDKKKLNIFLLAHSFLIAGMRLCFNWRTDFCFEHAVNISSLTAAFFLIGSEENCVVCNEFTSILKGS